MLKDDTWLTPPLVALTVAAWVDDTAPTTVVKTAELVPGRTVTLAGSRARVVAGQRHRVARAGRDPA